MSASPTPAHCIDWGAQGNHPGPLWTSPPAWRLPPHTQAGGHPDGTATFSLRRVQPGNSSPGAGPGSVDGAVDNIYVELPAGFVADPNAVAECSAEQFAVQPPQCPPESQVGVLQLSIVGVSLGGANLGNVYDAAYPVWNIEPRHGNLAELGFAYASGERAISARIVAKARTNSDFGITTFIGQIPAPLPPMAQAITIWGVPWAATNDLWRAPALFAPDGACSDPPELNSNVSRYLRPNGFSPACQTPYDPSWGPIRPFVSNVTECTGGDLSTRITLDSFQNPGAFASDGSPVSGKVGPNDGDPLLPNPIDNTLPGWKTYDAPAPPMTGCAKVPFDGDFDFAPSTTVAGAPSGLSVGLSVPQNDDPPAAVAENPDPDSGAPAHWRSDAGLATSHLDRAVVQLPAGFTVNPSGASGLRGCSDAQIGLVADGSPPRFDNSDPFDGIGADCPDASKLGTVSVDVPALDEPLTGELVLGEPRSTDPASGQMLRLFVVARNADRGIIAKIAGSSIPDGNVGGGGSGRVTAVFDKNPRVPFEHMQLELRGGQRGLLAMPQGCGDAAWSSTLTPWTAAHGAGGQPVTSGGAFAVDQRCAFRFTPVVRIGTDNRRGGAIGSRFTMELARDDDEQWLRQVTAKLPKGLLGVLRQVPLCTDAEAAAASCPESSRIATLDASAGAGDPLVVEEKGGLYLTEGYNGCAYGFLAKVRAIAGPFRGPWELTPIAVRQAVCVDPASAQVSVVSDPLPTVWHGVPLRVRRILVDVDRPGFLRNPTSCSGKRVRADLGSPAGATSSPIAAYRATDCAKLRFRPKLTMRLVGRRQMTTGRHPAIRAQVTQRAGEAGIRRARVRLPGSLALDPDNAQALCEFEDGTKPNLEELCPRGSIVGRARAVSPLLKRPLRGDVYFVKNVRIDPDTGNEIRTLPMVVVALRGEVAVNLVGNSSVDGSGRLVSTFRTVPDAPIARFNLNIKGGRNGILAVTRTRRSTIDLCGRPRRAQIAQADMDAHNRRRFDPDVRVKVGCGKAGKRAKRRGSRR